MYFWFSESRKPFKVRIPEDRGTNVNTIIYAAKRFDPSVEWTEEACAKIVKVPRIFLKRVFKGVVEQAKADGVTVITAEFMDKVQDKRRMEKEESEGIKTTRHYKYKPRWFAIQGAAYGAGVYPQGIIWGVSLHSPLATRAV